MTATAHQVQVLMTADTVGGVWTYAIELARALADEGVGIALATMGRLPSTAQRKEARSIAGLELFESEYRLPWMDRPWGDVAAAGEWLLSLAARVKPDIVHLNEPVYGALPWPAPTVVVSHSCVVSWWEQVRGESAPSSWSHYRRKMEEGLSAADVVVAPSAWTLGQLHRHYGVTHGHVVHNGRDSHQFLPQEKASFVFAAGRLWDPAKNLLALDAAAAGLPWPVYAAGEVQGYPDEAGVTAKHMKLLGPLSSSSVATWLGHACIYAFPARYEPFGLSILEAALAGCVLVLGDLPTLRELWEGQAIFVPPDQPEVLQDAIRALIEDASLRLTLAMRARRRALRLSPRRMALAYWAIYSDLLSGRPSRQEAPACAS
jgi:glycogen synthase